MLSEKDRREYKQGMYDLYVEVGTSKIMYHALLEEDPLAPPDIYGEREKEYAPPVNLVGVVTPMTPTSDPLMFANNIDKRLYKFDIIGLALEKNNLDPYKMDSGILQFEEDKFTIISMTPQGMFTDFYTTFEFIGELIP